MIWIKNGETPCPSTLKSLIAAKMMEPSSILFYAYCDDGIAYVMANNEREAMERFNNSAYECNVNIEDVQRA